MGRMRVPVRLPPCVRGASDQQLAGLLILSLSSPRCTVILFPAEKPQLPDFFGYKSACEDNFFAFVQVPSTGRS